MPNGLTVEQKRLLGGYGQDLQQWVSPTAVTKPPAPPVTRAPTLPPLIWGGGAAGVIPPWLAGGGAAAGPTTRPAKPFPELVDPQLRAERETDIQTLMAWGLSQEEAEKAIPTKPGLGYTVKNIVRTPDGGFRVTWTPPPGEPPISPIGYEDLSPWEEAQVERWKREEEWAKQQAEREREWAEQQAEERRRQWELEFGWKKEETARSRQLEQQLWQAQQLLQLAGPADWIRRWQLMRGDVPPAPEWLPEFAPSQVAGQPITQAPTRTPSGQLWGRTPWSHREGLRGYTEYAGYRPYMDIMEHMAMMQPTTPAGAGQRRWQPARQWA